MVVRLDWSKEQPPGKIRDVSCTASDLDVKLDERAGEPVVVVNVPQGYTLPRQRGHRITVHTDDPIVPRLDIPLHVARQSRVTRTQSKPEARPRGAARRGIVGQAGSINPGSQMNQPAQRRTPDVKPLPRSARPGANRSAGNTAANQKPDDRPKKTEKEQPTPQGNQ
jgi:hypothetical protein